MSGFTINPGLDLAALRVLRAPRHDEQAILRRIENHLAAHGGYVPISGGKDSAVVAHLALQVDPNVAMVFFDSGLEFPETYAYLAALVESWNINLHVVPAERSLLSVLVEDGSWDHNAPLSPTETDLHALLITTPARKSHERFGAGELWGVRADESKGRGVLYRKALTDEINRSCHGDCATPRERRQRHGGIIRRQDGTVAFGPVWDWSLDDILGYVARHRVPLNPAYAKLRALGAPVQAQRISHLLDGSRLEEGRATWLKAGWPQLFDELAEVLPRLREFV